MVCKKCGREIPDGSAFCEFCGERAAADFVPIPLVDADEEIIAQINESGSMPCTMTLTGKRFYVNGFGKFKNIEGWRKMQLAQIIELEKIQAVSIKISKNLKMLLNYIWILAALGFIAIGLVLCYTIGERIAALNVSCFVLAAASVFFFFFFLIRTKKGVKGVNKKLSLSSSQTAS